MIYLHCVHRKLNVGAPLSDLSEISQVLSAYGTGNTFVFQYRYLIELLFLGPPGRRHVKEGYSAAHNFFPSFQEI